MKKIAVIVAGGTGSRMQADQPKQFIPLLGEPILIHTIKTFVKAYADIRLIVVLPAAHFEEGRVLINKYCSEKVELAQGGDTRFQSVKNGLALITEQESVVFVHDAVRCLLTTSLIERCFETASVAGSAIPVIPANDSIRLVTASGQQVLNRSEVMLVQTPQTFLASWLVPAFQTLYEPSFTDEATVVERTGKKINLIAGEVSNIKITQPVDLLIATQWLTNQNATIA
jgi:2-C-methyl-D-erythritol 4-phosphate cytidylyltransferase